MSWVKKTTKRFLLASCCNFSAATCIVDHYEGCSSEEVQEVVGEDMTLEELLKVKAALCGEVPGCHLNQVNLCLEQENCV